MLISQVRNNDSCSSILDDITKEILDEMQKEREKGNRGRKKKAASRTENDDISDDNYNEIEVKYESSEEEIEDDDPIDCWKSLSPPTAEEDVVNKWYGCIYTSKRGPNLFIGKATQRF